ncbi:hypothetical protein [Bradyrhizobium sp. B120]|uniref:hypothetical protein n=1 Tax=Bradyrhizobium sp. B120 TaxID=3410088 RepID=UPI003B97D897
MHAFPKKSTSGVATPQRHIDPARRRGNPRGNKGRPMMARRRSCPPTAGLRQHFRRSRPA